MAHLDWSQCSVLESTPGKVSGAWVFRGTRVPVSAILRNLTLPLDELLEDYPSVTHEQIETVLDSLACSADPVFSGEISPEDRYIAEARLEKRGPTLTSRQARKELGLAH